MPTYAATAAPRPRRWSTLAPPAGLASATASQVDASCKHKSSSAGAMDDTAGRVRSGSLLTLALIEGRSDRGVLRRVVLCDERTRSGGRPGSIVPAVGDRARLTRAATWLKHRLRG
jgi:hypothetical protein